MGVLPGGQAMSPAVAMTGSAVLAAGANSRWSNSLAGVLTHESGAFELGALWTSGHGFAWILYPFFDGPNGFERSLSDAQWMALGKSLRAVHSAVLPATLATRVPREEYSPQWRDAVVHCRFLPSMTVSNALVPPAPATRPAAVTPIRGLFLAGDWVGNSGLLSDAALASARDSAKAMLAS